MYPKDIKENLVWRRKMLSRAKEDLEYRDKLRVLFFKDPLFAFNGFFWTFDVRRKPDHHLPFCTYDYQDEVILDLVEAIKTATANNPQDRLIKKSRDMGASWLVILVFEYLWLNPTGGYDFLLGSRIEDYVDKKGDMRTLFEKARYNLYRLPFWLMPKGFNTKLHDNFMRLINPETGAAITGESNNPSFSTGGRYAAILLDEFAKWEVNDERAWTSSGDASPCRIVISTPWGAGGKFYELAHDPKIKKHVLHWSKHPAKREGLYCVWPKPVKAGNTVDEDNWTGLRSIWYDQQTLNRARSALDIAQELDIDFIGSGNPVFDGVAGDRLALLLRDERKPVKIYSFDSESGGLHEVDYMYEHVDYLMVYDLPNPARSYVVACDIAEGKESGDFSVVKVFCRETRSVAATYAAKIDEVSLAKFIAAVHEMYSFDDKKPWWAVETNGPGLAVFDLLVEVHELDNPFLMPVYDSVKNTVSHRKGWWTSTVSRRALVGGLKEWLNEGIGWCDKRCAHEMQSFIIDKTGKACAKEGTNDDEVMCLGIAIQVDKMVPSEEADERALVGLAEQMNALHEHKRFAPVAEPSFEEKVLTHALQKKLENGSFFDELFRDRSNFERIEDLFY